MWKKCNKNINFYFLISAVREKFVAFMIIVLKSEFNRKYKFGYKLKYEKIKHAHNFLSYFIQKFFEIIPEVMS